jgi:hypothetical protein
MSSRTEPGRERFSERRVAILRLSQDEVILVKEIDMLTGDVHGLAVDSKLDMRRLGQKGRQQIYQLRRNALNGLLHLHCIQFVWGLELVSRGRL